LPGKQFVLSNGWISLVRTLFGVKRTKKSLLTQISNFKENFARKKSSMYCFVFVRVWGKK
jgi:hypothetical protein